MLAMFDDDEVKMKFFENLLAMMPPVKSPEEYIDLRRKYDELARQDRTALHPDELSFLDRVLSHVRVHLRHYEDADPNEIVSNILSRATVKS